jgi:hypothetical protein
LRRATTPASRSSRLFATGMRVHSSCVTRRFSSLDADL